MEEYEYPEHPDADPTVMRMLQDWGLEYTRENYLEMLLFGLEGEELERMKHHGEILSQLPEDLIDSD